VEQQKIREDRMTSEQNLKLAIMDSVGDTMKLRDIIALPPLATGLSRNVYLGHHRLCFQTNARNFQYNP
jgi:hypothetical protein